MNIHTILLFKFYINFCHLSVSCLNIASIKKLFQNSVTTSSDNSIVKTCAQKQDLDKRKWAKSQACTTQNPVYTIIQEYNVIKACH